MVRMCEVMTYACATVLVAGSALAADKVSARLSPAREVQAAPMSVRQMVGSYNAGAENLFGLGGGCSCIWFNGAFDRRDGQASHLGGAIMHGAKAADDFYLCEGYVYDLESISGTLLTNSIEVLTKARLEIYADCDGCPGQLLYTLEKGTPTPNGTFGPNGELRVVDWTFTISNETKKENKNIVLHGGTYWISLYGLTDGQCPTMNMCDASYWGTTGNGQVIKGSVAKKIFGTPTSSWNQFNFVGPWSSVENCCVGCTDLAFTVCARPCKILIDNGTLRLQTSPGQVVGSTSQFAEGSWSSLETRSADDFVVPPCDPFQLCYIEGCVWTNCLNFKGAFEIYGNDCRTPSYSLHGSYITSGQATKIIDLGYNATLDNTPVRAYKLEFHDLSYTLDGGKNYWISIGVRYTFSALERAYFCYNADCSRSCLIRFNAGKVLTSTSTDYDGNPGWASVHNDFSFLIAGNKVTSAAPGSSQPTCTADYNRDGVVGTQDIFDFLASWFTGCP